MKLFPLHASPAALSQVVYDAWKTAAPEPNDALCGRAAELCGEAFDMADSECVIDWLFADRQRDDAMSLICAAIAGNEDDMRSAIERLREAWIDAKADDYIEDALEEAAEAAEGEQ